ncbi:ethanolamine utilization protein EutA (predicted chaperonin) [Streptomyces turgidiscabies]|uniref:Ethanolamine utilization protein EutA (Predicted chaperonin) n=1 Tax=Streptomyces turgidiscabies TaxID=85558 RepID=A0ABU0RPK8_9ACTN|nr:ethanolamine utilization protein EutA (predicted chaperonin) [Streptomyces turgidiscabies]
MFGLRGLAPAVGAVSELVAGGVVGGELVAAAGPDLHLAIEGERGAGVVVLDTRLMTGWGLVPVGEGGLTVPVREFKEVAGVQDGLF